MPRGGSQFSGGRGVIRISVIHTPIVQYYVSRILVNGLFVIPSPTVLAANNAVHNDTIQYCYPIEISPPYSTQVNAGINLPTLDCATVADCSSCASFLFHPWTLEPVQLILSW